MKIKLLFFGLLFVWFNAAYAQQVHMNSDDGNTITTCNGSFSDHDPVNGLYTLDGSQVVTICSDDPDMNIQADFTAFKLIDGYSLKIYDGNSTAAPLLGSYTGNTGPGTIFPSQSNTTGCLTFEYVGSGAAFPGAAFGWEAELSCREACQDIDASITSVTPSELDGGVYTISYPDEVTFNADAVFEDNPDNATFNWDFGDGNTAQGTTVTHTYSNLGTYTVEFEVIDEDDCVAIVTIQVEVVFDSQQEGDCAITTVNYDFEEPTITQSTGYPTFEDQEDVPGWSTTATDGIIEMWPNSNLIGGVQAYSGNQYIELNANQVSGVYQDYQTPVAGTEFYFSFAHSARNSAPTGEDVLGVYAGAPGRMNQALIKYYPRDLGTLKSAHHQF